MADFESEVITLKNGESVMETLRDALDKKGIGDRMDSENGIFIIDNVTVKSIIHLPLEGDEVQLEVQYEYGG